MTHFATPDPLLDGWIGASPDADLDRGFDGALGTAQGEPDPGPDLGAQLARLNAVVRDLASPPADRDPVLWAAHEFSKCAQTLLAAHGAGAHGSAGGSEAGAEVPDGDLGAALDFARSAMLSLTIARRAETGGPGGRCATPGNSSRASRP